MRRVVLLLTTGLLFACPAEDDDDPPPSRDGGPARDAGVVERDAGTPDSGCEPEIAITAFDVTLEEPFTYSFPETTGPYSVGTHVLHLTDESRDEPNTPEPDDKRRFVVQLFYPTDVTDGPPAPYMEDGVAAALSASGFPANFHRSIQTRSTFDVPIAQGGPWPVLIYGHGLTAWRGDNQPLLEDLASHGYVVASVSFTYSSAGVVLEDGTVAGDRTEFPANTVDANVVFTDTLQALLQDVWANDVVYTVASLAELNGPTCHFLNGALDLENVGLMGYSFGGATAHHTCAMVDGCVAALGLDGALYGDNTQRSDRPSMNLMQFRVDHSWDAMHEGLLDDGHTVRIKDVIHQNFSVYPHLIRAFFPNLDLVAQGISGPLGPDRMAEIYWAYTHAFFDTHVRGMPRALITDETPYPEVLYERSNAGRTDRDLTVVTNLNGPRGPVEGASVAAVVGTTTTATTTSDEAGFVQIDGLPKDSDVDLVVEHPEFYPVVYRVPLRGTDHQSFFGLLSSPAATTALLGSGNSPVDPSRGHVQIISARERDGHTIGVIPGVGLSMAMGQGPYYPGFNGFDPAATETGGNGLGYYVNVPPGTRTVMFTHATLSCREVRAAPGAPAGSAEVRVDAGRLTILIVLCDE